MHGINPIGVLVLLAAAMFTVTACDSCVMTGKGLDVLRTKEVQLFDNTKATCVYTGDGVFCIRHVTDNGKEVSK